MILHTLFCFCLPSKIIRPYVQKNQIQWMWVSCLNMLSLVLWCLTFIECGFTLYKIKLLKCGACWIFAINKTIWSKLIRIVLTFKFKIQSGPTLYNPSNYCMCLDFYITIEFKITSESSSSIAFSSSFIFSWTIDWIEYNENKFLKLSK